MSRLIDADKLIEDIYSSAYACTNDEINEILSKQLETNINVINNQPTAFDVDKVIEQLDELVTINMEVIGVRADYVNLAHVIKIVKRGGIDEN
jgi:hypothetical protein